MIPKTIKENIPNGLEPINDQRLSQWNPDIVDHETATGKISNREVFDSPNRGRMLTKPL